MKRTASLAMTMLLLAAGYALADGTEEFTKRLSVTTHFNCPVPVETINPSTYPLDGA